MSKKLIANILSFLTILLLFTNVAKAEKACLPRDHATMKEMGLGYVVDNIVGIITDQIFGPIPGNTVNIFQPNTASWGNRDWDQGIVKKMFLSITTDAKFLVLFYLSVTLLITYLGVSFAMGYSTLSSSQLLKEFLKIGIIIFFVTPAGWDFYLEFIVKNILEASRYFNKAIIASMYNIPIESVSSPFQPINMILSLIFNEYTWSKMASLMFAGGFLFAILVLVVILYILVTAVIVLFKAVILYATTIIIASVLLSVGPVFAVFALFDKTRSYFNKWITNLVGIFMQQYILFLGFFLFCVIITAMLKGVFYFESCMGVAMAIKFKVAMPQFIKDIVGGISSMLKALSFGTFKGIKLGEWLFNVSWPIFYSYMPTQPIHSFPANIFSIAGIFIVTMMFGKFIDMVSDLGSELANADLKASSIAPKAAMEGLTKIQKGADSVAAEAAKDVVTGRAALVVSRAPGAAQDYLDQKIASREAAGKKGLVTKALKAINKPVSLAASVADKTGFSNLAKLVQTDDKINRMRAIESNQVMARKIMDKEIADRVGKGSLSKGATVADLGPQDKKEIDEAVKRGLMEKGHSGVFKTDKYYDSNGKEHTKVTELPIEAGFVEESLKAKIVREIPKVGIVGTLANKVTPTSKLGADLSLDAKKESIIKRFVKNTVVKTNLLNRVSRKNHW